MAAQVAAARVGGAVGLIRQLLDRQAVEFTADQNRGAVFAALKNRCNTVAAKAGQKLIGVMQPQVILHHGSGLFLHDQSAGASPVPGGAGEGQSQ